MTTQTTRGGLTVIAAAAVGLVLAGCVSTETFEAHVAEVNSRMAATEGRVGALDGRVGALDARVAANGQAVQAAQARADSAYKLAEGKFNMTVVAREQVNFALGSSALSDQAKTTLTNLARRLRTENRNVYLEIRGHTDATGAATTNRQLGRERAASTARFLVDQGVPGNRVQLGSWGEEVPGVDADSNADNRRVEILVVS